jgi:hypothetical protein
MKRITKATRTLVPGVVALALLAGCGEAVATQPNRSLSLPNVEFERLAVADRLELSAHLDGQAWTYLGIPRSTDQASEFVPGSRHMPSG